MPMQKLLQSISEVSMSMILKKRKSLREWNVQTKKEISRDFVHGPATYKQELSWQFQANKASSIEAAGRETVRNDLGRELSWAEKSLLLEKPSNSRKKA